MSSDCCICITGLRSFTSNLPVLLTKAGLACANVNNFFFFFVKSQFNYITDFKAGLTSAVSAALVIKLLSVRLTALIYSSVLAAAKPCFPPSCTEYFLKETISKVRCKPAEKGVGRRKY